MGSPGLPDRLYATSLQADQLKKLLLILLLSSVCIASGPKYSFQDPHLEDEFVNVYKDISSILRSNTKNSTGYIIGTTIQVIRMNDTSSTTSVGTAYTTTTTAATITPKSTTNKIKITAVGTLANTAFSTSNSYASIFRGTTDLEGTGNGFVLISGNAANTVIQVPATLIFLDSPVTTSAVTYSVKIKSDTAAKTGWNGNGTAVIILEEIAQ